MPAPTLPPEIVHSIIAEVALENNPRWRIDDLHTCCQISRAFVGPAQAALYKHLRVRFFRRDTDDTGDTIWPGSAPPPEEEVIGTDSRALELTLLTHPHLGLLVRSLYAESEIYEYPGLHPQLPAHVVAVLLRCCPNLDDLSIGQETDSGLAGLLDVVCSLRPSLKKLSIASADPLVGDASKALAELTGLEHLVIRDRTFRGFAGDGEIRWNGDEPQRSRLTSLTIEVQNRPFSSEMLSRYAQSSAASLRTIHLAFDEFDFDLSPFTNLNSLTFRFILRRDHPVADPRPALAEKLALCLRRAGPQVRRLTLAAAAGTDDYDFQSGMVAPLLLLLPPSLTSLDISSYSISAADLLPFLQPSSSPSLRRLVLRGIASGNRPGRNLSEVFEVAAARGVVVELTRSG